ncbi:serine/threonine-protein kinase [Geodermatophilus ruber]|uniref:non-specific serine/threonine protein kinase n=1 Tax=Geodermatophilus ruber TaxID=504800 RepID=A0A1I4JD14_9ACTN|nr:serine/threonine-protein kinase [Geodermatophilus ruber]SFL64063.1 serine/threonine protein kinase [Geodermatophilus ruber]
MVEPGRRHLGDRYELASLIAAGGMGQVWRGTDALLARPVAVKVLRSEYTGDPTFLARFRAEAQHAAALSHPNIAAVYDYGEVTATDGSGETLAYLVMELVEGEPLSAVLQREGRLDAGATLAVLEQTAAALAEAHRVGLVHRDVKPGNILVRDDGSVKITDFGIAWSAGSVPLTKTGQVMGTPQYLAPEQAEGQHPTPASDVYALGLVGYECLTGHPAFDGENAVTIALKQLREDPDPLPADLPGDVRTLIRRAMCKEPGVRIPDGAAFVAAIQDLRAGHPQPEPSPTRAVPVLPPPALPDGGPPAVVPATGPGSTSGTSSPPPPSPRPRRRRVAAVLVPLVALLLGAATAAAVFAVVSDGQGRMTVGASQTRDGEQVVLDAGDYLGRPVDEVALSLSARGLLVNRQEQVSGDALPGMVTGVSPTGVQLSAGDDVLVSFAVAPPETSAPRAGSPPVASVTGEEDSTPSRERSPRTTAPAPTPAPAPVERTPSPRAQPEELPGTGPAPSPSTTRAAPSPPTTRAAPSPPSSSPPPSSPPPSTSAPSSPGTSTAPSTPPSSPAAPLED